MSFFECTDLKELVPIPEPGTRSFADFYLEEIDKYPASFIVDGVSEEKLHFAEMASHIRVCSSNLLKKGYKKGDTICLMSKNSHNFIVALLAGSLSHVTISPANPAYTGHELLYQLDFSDSNAVIVGSDQIGSLEDALKLAVEEKRNLDLKDIYVLNYNSTVPATIQGIETKPFEHLLRTDNGSLMESETSLDPKSDVWLLPFSSGTTGLPKGVALTHYNMLANIWQFVKYDPVFGLRSHHTLLAVLPMYHIYGLLCFALAAPMNGANVVLLPEFNPVNFLLSIQKYRCSHVYIVPPLALFLGKDPRVKEYDLTSLIDVVSAAAPLAADVASQAFESLQSQGLRDFAIRQAWGMTELSPVGTAGRYKANDLDCFASIGDPIPFTQVKIVDLSSREVVPWGQEGELCVKGPQVMKGYFKNEEATRNTIDTEGWLLTGDIAKVNEKKQMTITDRLKELIKTKGFQVAPAELEGILLTHPAVQDCCVFGTPHDSLGEAPSACVVLKPGGGASRLPSEQEVKAFVGQKVAPYKQLAGGVTFVDQIPKTASGKILRRVLRARFL